MSIGREKIRIKMYIFIEAKGEWEKTVVGHPSMSTCE